MGLTPVSNRRLQQWVLNKINTNTNMPGQITPAYH